MEINELARLNNLNSSIINSQFFVMYNVYLSTDKKAYTHITKEIEGWLKENTEKFRVFCYHGHNRVSVTLYSQIDAMAFILRWSHAEETQ